MTNETTDHEELKSIGGTLLLARTEKGWSQEDIAKKLHLSKTFVQYLENDEFNRLAQSPVFIRGYVRSYARLVNIPEETIVRLLDMSNIKDTNLENKKIFLSAQKQVSVRDKKMRWLTYAIVILFLILIFIWWRSHMNERHYKKVTNLKVAKQQLTTAKNSTEGNTQSLPSTVNPPKVISKKIMAPKNTSKVTNQLHMDYNG